MKKRLVLGTLSLAVASFLIGCGSSSSTTATESTGYFIDSAVKGVPYATSSGITGITDAFGRFQYKQGDSVELHLGNLSLGSVEPEADGKITPATLAGTNEELQILLLRTLQTLDVDGNSSNGITITSELLTALADINETSIEDLNETTLLELDSDLYAALDHDFDGEIDVDITEATTHFEESLSTWDNGERPDSNHGNGNGRYGENNTTGGSSADTFDLSQYPLSVLTQDLKDSLAYMGNEERLAYDMYHNLYNYHLTESATEIKQLKNISEKSEIKHVGIVQELVQRYELNATDISDVINPVATRDVAFEDMPSGEYDIPVIQSLYNTLYAKGVTSINDALMVGCMIEVTDVNDLDIDIALAEDLNATDISEAFKVLRDGSYNHYWAFDKGLKNRGVIDGCYVEGDAILGERKDGIYPQTEH